MAVFDIIPQTNVTGNDIRDTLAAGGGSVNNDARTWFKPEAKINMWSKYKPVDYAQENTELFPNWWKANDGNCGFAIKQVASYLNVPTSMDGVMNGWQYILPYGGAVSPYRWTDFRGYAKGAIPIVDNFYVNDKVIADSEIGFSALFNRSGTNLLSLEDMETAKDCYLGVYVAQKGGSIYRRKTASSKIKDGGTSVVFTRGTFTVGEWEAYPFLAANEIPQEGSDPQNTYYTLINLKKRSMSVVTSFFNISLTANLAPPDSNHISWKAIIYNDSSTRTFTNNYITFRYADKAFTDPFVQGEKRIPLQDITVPTESQYNLSGGETVDWALLESPQGCKVWLSLQSAVYLASTNVIKPK